MRHITLFIIYILGTTLLLSSCVFNSGNMTVTAPKRAIGIVSVSRVAIINNQLVITGANLSSVQNIKVEGKSLNEAFTIESKSATKIVANSLQALNITAGSLFNLIMSDANAAATFPIDFTLCSATLNTKGFDCSVTPNNNDVLTYDSSSGKWTPKAINLSGLTYVGAYDASLSVTPSGPVAGEYWIISGAGTINSKNYNIGDWLVYNGSGWDKIDNSSANITSVHGRSGVVVGEKNDYSLGLMSDVTLGTLSGADNGKVLQFNGTEWVPAIVSGGGGTPSAGSITSTELAADSITSAKIVNDSIVDADINSAAAISQSKISNLTTDLAGKEPTVVASGNATDYYKGNKTWSNFATDAINALSSTLSNYATTSALNTTNGNVTSLSTTISGKADSTNAAQTISTLSVSATAAPSGNYDLTNKFYVDGLLAGKEATLPSGTNLQYIKGDKTLGNFATDAASALTSTLAGYVTTSDLSTAVNTKLNKTGGTLSGDLTLNSNLILKDSGTNYVTIKANSSTTNSYDFILPNTAGTNGQVLRTDGSGNLSWYSIPGAIANTDSLTEGSSNLYFSNSRAQAALASTVAGLATTTALGITNTNLAAKEPAITNPNDSSLYYRGDKTFATLDTAAVVENSNLYFTNSRAVSALKGSNFGNIATITGIADPISPGDIVNLGYLSSNYASLTSMSGYATTGALANKLNKSGGTLSGALTIDSNLLLKDSSTNYVTIKANAATTAYDFILPGDAGSAGQVLKTDGCWQYFLVFYSCCDFKY